MTTSHESLFLNSFYVGINIESILYGIELLLHFKTMRTFLSNRGTHKKTILFYVLFSSIVMFSTTVWVAIQTIFGEKMWVLESDFPGGPYAYWKTKTGAWYMGWATITVITMQLMTDALMICRCRIVWNSYHVTIVPTILWLASFALGVVLAWTTSSLGSEFHTSVAAHLSLAYWSVSVSLNTSLTCLICYCVVRHGKRIQVQLGSENTSFCFAVTAIIVESILPCTLSGIGSLVALGLGSATSATFICVYFLTMSISSQMLILRMIVGKAWDSETFSQPGSTINIDPANGDVSGSRLFENGREGIQLQIFSRENILGRHDKVRTSEL